MRSKDTTKDVRCPCCGRSIDPLRSQAVSIVDGRIVHFCSATCREQHLYALSSAGGEDPAAAASSAEEATHPAVEVRSDRDALPPVLSPSTTSPAQPKGDDAPARSAKGLGWRRWPWRLVGFLLVALVGAWWPGALPPMAYPGLVAAVLLVVLAGDLWRERGAGALRLADVVALPFAGLTLLAASLVSPPGHDFAIAASLLPLLDRLGRMLESRWRKGSGVAAFLAGRVESCLATHWTDNSILGERLRRAAVVVEAVRWPIAFGVAGLFRFVFERPTSQSLVTAATLLVVLSPRLVRLIVSDALLGASIQAARLGVTVRDGRAAEALGRARIAYFLPEGVLIEPALRVRELNAIDPSDAPTLWDELRSLEAGVGGNVAVALCQGLEAVGARLLESVDAELRPDLGVLGRVRERHLICGNRELMLAEGILTAAVEAEAQAFEASGRRVVFVAREGVLAAWIGLEQEPLAPARDAVQRLSAEGIETWMVSGADVEAAQGLATRLGIDHVRFRTSRHESSRLLNELAETGLPVVCIGHGPAFEEAWRAASVAISLGGRAPSLAGCDARDRDVGVVPDILAGGRRALGFVTRNLLLALVTTFVGVELAVGWHTPLSLLIAFACCVLTSALCTRVGPSWSMSLVHRWRERWSRLRRERTRPTARP